MLKNSQILLIFALLLSIEFYSISAESQVQAGNITFYPTNQSLVNRNIIIVIDSSGSTAVTDPITGVSAIGLIDANAINIVRKLGRCSYAGVVVFGGETRTTDMLPMSNDTKAQLEKFIRDIGPKGGDNPTDIENGLRSAEKLLDSIDGAKEIIVLSDGMMPPEGFEQTKTIVSNLKNESIKIHFIQIRMYYEPNKEPNILYNKLAQAADGQVIVLNPDERVSIITEHSAIESNEPCIAPTPTVTPNPTITINETPIPSSLSTPSNQITATRAEEIGRIKTPGFEGIFTILIFFVLIKLKP